MNLYWLEIKRFIKEYAIKIVIGAILLGILLGGALTYLRQSSPEKEQEEEIEDSELVFENDSRAAFFRFYIERPDGTSFNNAPTMNDLFNMRDLYQEVLTETNIDIEEIKELAEEKEVPDFSPIKVSTRNDSYIFTAVFETGDDQDNLELANFYYDSLFGERFSILENNKIYSVTEPILVEDTEEAEAEKVTQSKKSTSEIVRTIISNSVIGIILSTALMIGLALLNEMFGKKLNFIFGYDAEDFDEFMIYDKKLDNEKSLQYFARIPHSAKKLVLVETGLSEAEEGKIFNNSDSNIDISHSIESTSTSDSYDEIIVIVKVSETTRKWYNDQRKLIGLQDAQSKLIQLNDDFTTNN